MNRKEIDWTEYWDEDIDISFYDISYCNIVELYRISKKLIQMGYEVYNFKFILYFYERSFGTYPVWGNKLIYSYDKEGKRLWIQHGDMKKKIGHIDISYEEFMKL